ncbi:MAG: Gfo/Idh/MocA family oxidoreductase [Acidobacteria bacterium]|nr:Gfo/Idh/MocA family oxidoreductase [Acidobacteriota bacterium]
MDKLTRRMFTRKAGAMAALSYSRILGANERIQIGYVGVGNHGDALHDAFLEHGDCQTVAVCDLRDDYMNFAVEKSIRKSGSSPKKYQEYQKLVEDKEVDAVVIATPDHWHALMFIDACRSGKDVYVEKPLSLTVVEGRRMVETADQTKRVVQVGLQRRLSQFLKEGAEFVRSGGIGHVTAVRCFQIENHWPVGIGNPPDEPPPSEWEWERWLGPAPKLRYNRNRTYYKFRWFYDYSGGQLTNSGVHLIDMIRWCLSEEAPHAVTAMGGKYAVKDNREIPDTLEVLWEFDAPTMVSFIQYNCSAAAGGAQGSEMELRGTKGTMYIHGNRWEVVPEKITDLPRFARTPLDRQTERGYTLSRKPVIDARSAKGSMSLAFHARNFLDCVKSRAQCNCDTLTGHLSTTATLIGNIALRTKSYLEWDCRRERFTNNEAANRWLQYKYRAPYRLS